ncbi:hypothetical protein RYZ20_06480 [Thioclava sp. A2]|uniref:hypothetical protein n=1 Tax=Thioclava sp. FCG-A2 TaxID=3080562 RepID=UPI002952F345|nr:hypothetical protein [Thioclava sp. A2]MDV7270542.1 hypothetical protein [Thioclava sp. A2]
MAHIPFMRLPRYAPHLLVMALTVSGCSVTEMRQDDDKRLQQLSHGQDALDEFSPLDGASHLVKGKALLAGAGSSLHDLYFARSAFERAAVLQVDDPAPYYLAGYTNYRLGNYDAAYRAFLGAARLDQSSDGWWMAALSALRSNHELLAQALYDKGKQARPGRSVILGAYMHDLYAAGSGAKIMARFDGNLEAPSFTCEKPDEEIEGKDGICASDLQVELFIVERQAESGSSIGQDLMAGLTIGVSGTPYEFTRSRTHSRALADGAPASTLDTGSDITRTNGITIDLPSVDYALSMASDAEAVNTISSTPVLKVALDQDAKLFVGQNLHIVGADGTDDSIDEDVGITLELELQKFTGTAATLHAAAEISDYVPPVLGQTFTKVEIDSSTVESGGQVPYNTAFLLGSLEMTSRDDARGGQKGLRQIPVVGNLFGNQVTSVATHEVAILLTVRPPEAIEKSQETIFLNDLKNLGVTLPTVAKRVSIVHKSPTLGAVIGEMGLLP